jgi:hypothetical protein
MGNISDISAYRDEDNALLSRYIDNEASAEERANIEQRLRQEPALASHYRKLCTLNLHLSCLRTAKEIEVPEQISRLLTQTGENAHHSTDHQQRAATTARRFLRPLLASAATLTLAVGIGLFSQTQSVDQPPLSFVSALTSQISDANQWHRLDDGSELQIVLSFSASDGNWCREFRQSNQEGHWHGVACKSADSWITPVKSATSPIGAEQRYRPASGESVNDVSRFIDNTMTNMALTPNQETQIIDKGWPEQSH